MFKIGCHLSIAKGYLSMGRDALKIGANTFQFFMRNPRGTRAKVLQHEDIKKFQELMKDNHFFPLLAHAPYTLNPCSCDEKIRTFTKEILADDILRLESIKGSMYNLHPGNHCGEGESTAITRVAEMLNDTLKENQSTTVLLETMSGKGSEIGKVLEELKEIINRVNLSTQLGVCLDTCHMYSAGYDIRDRLERVLECFDSIIGLHCLKAVHLNDSMTSLNSRKDRHAPIGKGTIGAEAVIRIINHPVLKELPFYLETPLDLQGHAEEIKWLREHVNQ